MPARVYETDDLVIEWHPERCVHVARCMQSAPAVFDSSRRPWVVPEAGTTEEIVAAVEACPTGALRYRRTDGTGEPAGVPASVVPVRNGPLVVRGAVRVLAEDGSTLTEEARLAFCRCGHSENQPFCDNSHRRVAFESRAPTPATDRADGAVRAEAPAEICDPQPPSFT